MRFTGRMMMGALLLGVAVSGCAMQKAPAEKAIAKADSTMQTMATDAQAYVPDLYAAAGAKLTAARADLEAKKYKDALAKATEATTDIGDLGAAITAKKAELSTAWKSMSDSLPGTVKAIQARIDELSKMRRLPAGMTKATLDGATTSMQEMTGTWTKAMEAFNGGNVAGAMSMAQTVKSKATEVKKTLGMK